MLSKKLIQNLESQVEMHQVLLDTLNQEKNLPASCSLLELEEIHSTRDLTTNRIFELESSRIRLMNKFSQGSQLKENLSLKNIIKKCDKKTQAVLQELRLELKDLIDAIQLSGKNSAEKAVARIACFNELQKSLNRSFSKHSLYSMKGVMTKPKGAYMVQKSI